MSKCARGDLPDAAHQFAEGGGAGQAGPQEQRIYEEADHPLGFELGSPGSRGPDDDLVMAGPSMKEQFVRRQQCYEERVPLAVAEFAQGLDQLGLEIQDPDCLAGLGIRGGPG